MSARRSLRLPIALAIVLILLIVALIAGWVWVSVAAALARSDSQGWYWAALSVGTTFLVMVLVGVVVYLVLSIKAINLTQRQSNFIDSVTHELKSPIASLKLVLQTLNHRQVAPEEQAHFLRFMLDDVQRLDDLISQVLAAGELEKEAADYAGAPVDVVPLIESCAAIVCQRHHAPADSIRLHLAPAAVAARPVHLEMIFRNLLDNAIKYGGETPRVDVHGTLAGDQLRVTIRDNGAGIPRKLRSKIFGRFVRLGLELERKQPGTGLGLHIVRNLVRRLHGEVLLRDAQPGPGMVFEVRLPAQPPVRAAGPSPAPAPAPAAVT